MNDLDLQAALHRDADLVGSPSPDLLDQLSRRRDRRRRQQVGLGIAVLGVVAIGAGIPLGTAVLAGPDGGRTATDPATPTVSTPVPPSAAPLPTALTPAPPAVSSPVPPSPGTTAPATSVPASATPSAPRTPAVSAPVPPASGPAPTTSAGAGAAVSCPGVPTLRAALPADSADHWYTMDPAYAEIVCSGTWAAAGYSEQQRFPADPANPDAETVYGNGQAGLFRFAGGRWTLLDRTAHCDDAGIPAAVWERGCNVD